jgi:hypothetical protein
MSHKNKVIDSDAVFEINPITREIKNVSTTKKVLVQYDHNSERFTFMLPRHIEGHDMTECNRVQVHYETNGGYKDFAELPALVESEEKPGFVVCTWLITQKATRDIGSLKFLLKFACVNNDTGEYEYIWSTGLFNGISVSEGLNNLEGTDDIPPDFLYSITKMIEELEIPKNTSDLFNDSGFVTNEQMNEAISGIQGGAGGVVDAYTKAEMDDLLEEFYPKKTALDMHQNYETALDSHEKLFESKVDKYDNFGVVQVIDNDNAVDNFRSITIDVKYPNEISPLSYQIPTFNWAYEKFSRIEYAIDRIIEIQNELMGVSE